MKYVWLIFILFTFSCTTKTYTNNRGTCKLRLHTDSTYFFKYPTFLKSMRERGNYMITRDSIILNSKENDKRRSFKINQDTIIVNGLDPKAIGGDRELIKK